METGFRFQDQKYNAVQCCKHITETGFRFQNRKRKLVSISKIGNKNMETCDNYPPCPDTAKSGRMKQPSPPISRSG